MIININCAQKDTQKYGKMTLVEKMNANNYFLIQTFGLVAESAGQPSVQIVRIRNAFFLDWLFKFGFLLLGKLSCSCKYILFILY